jgi:hypothetical protein
LYFLFHFIFHFYSFRFPFIQIPASATAFSAIATHWARAAPTTTCHPWQVNRRGGSTRQGVAGPFWGGPIQIVDAEASASTIVPA